jgi:hypothetical protein
MTSPRLERTAGLLAALLSSALAACGDRAEPASAGAPDLGPPRWMGSVEETATGAKGLVLTAGAPCRVSVRFEGGDPMQLDAATRVLVAGESVEFSWLHAEGDARGISDVPPAAEAAEGRTEALSAFLSLGFGDGAVIPRRHTFWARPGKGRVLPPVDVVPPGVPHELPFGTEVELTAIGFADLAEGEATLFRSGGQSRLRLPPARPGDRSLVLRLVLRVDRP